MKCCKCDSEMKEAILCGGNLSVGVYLIQRRTDKDNQWDYKVKSFVCPECGYIELYSSAPHKFR